MENKLKNSRVEAEINDFLDSIDNLLQFKKISRNELTRLNRLEAYYNDLIIDIEHKMELLELDAQVMLDMAYDIQYYKRLRRDVKDLAFNLYPICETLERSTVSNAVKQLGDVAKLVHTNNKNNEERVYFIRQGEPQEHIKREYTTFSKRVKVDQPKKLVRVRKKKKEIKRNRKRVLTKRK